MPATTTTILARDPRPSPPPEDKDPAIEAMREILDRRTDKENHKVYEAASVEELRSKLVGPGTPDRVQIIGHGTPGMLSLGYHWTKDYSDDQRNYALDSNPFAHGALAEGGLVQGRTEVMLLGCSVGDDRKGATVARGPTLLFDLAQMWGCKVGAPIDVIGVGDFDPEGIFNKPSLLSFVEGFTFTPATSSPAIGTEPSGESERVTMTNVRRAPLLGARAGLLKDVPVTPSQSKEMWSAYDREAFLSPLLALPELVFDATWNGQPAIGEMLANGRMMRLRLTSSGAPRHFLASDQVPGPGDSGGGSLSVVSRIVRELLSSALGTPSPSPVQG